jgi:sulfotransferase
MRAPGDTLRHHYAMPDEPFFQHDFDNVEFQAEDFDSALGARGPHTVKRKVEWVVCASVLPPGLFDRSVNDTFWRDPTMDIRGVPIIRFGG